MVEDGQRTPQSRGHRCQAQSLTIRIWVRWARASGVAWHGTGLCRCWNYTTQGCTEDSTPCWCPDLLECAYDAEFGVRDPERGMSIVSETAHGIGDVDGSDESLVRSRRRMADHGEVFTPGWMVEAMLDLVKGETERIDSRFLEPACGSGNFLVPVLRRKLVAVELKFKQSDFEKGHYALVGLMCVYGIELLDDNIAECRANLLAIFAGYLKLRNSDDLYRAAAYVLSQNVIHGDALTMRDARGEPIAFPEWGYLGKGKFQRRDFRLDVLTQSSAFSEAGTLFAEPGKHEIFTPIKSHAPLTVKDLAG